MALRKIPSVALCTALSLLQAPVWAAPVAFESRKLTRANPSSPPTTPPASAATTTTKGSTAAAKPATPPAPASRATTAAPPAVTSPPKAAAAGAASPGKPDANPPDEQVKKARDLWYRGVEAFRAGNYEEARLAFAECYQIMPKSDVLRNLSISEIQSGHYVSAARHLTQLLATPGELPSNVREEANNRLAQAEAQIGQLQVAVDVAGAEVSIDGNVIGRSPLPGKWYIEPGQHEILVSKAGYPVESRQVFALAGVVIPVDVSLEALRREQAADAKAAELMGTREGEAPAAANDRHEISTASTIVLITTGTLAAASLAAGIIFTVSADGHESEAEGMAERLSGAGCGSATLAPDCELLKQELDASDADRKRATIAFIGFGVASAATLGYALWLTMSDDDPEPASAGVAPIVSLSRGGASIHLHGHF